MKYKTFLFRDLDNNLVLVRPDPDNSELDFQIIKDWLVKPHQLPLDTADVVDVTEETEGVYQIKALYQLKALMCGVPVGIAELSETNEDTFRKLIQHLYDQINESCAATA